MSNETREERKAHYPDSGAGAKAYLTDEAALPGIEGADARPDPARNGVWLVETPEWRAVVYLKGHNSWPEIRANDFEVEWKEEEG